MKAWILGGMLVFCGGLVACSSSSGSSTASGSGGSDGGGSSEGGDDSDGNGSGGDTTGSSSNSPTSTGSSPTSTGSSSPTSTGSLANSSSSTGGGACSDPLTGDPTCDACANSACCDEITACIEGTAVCFDGDGAFDPNSAGGMALDSCIAGQCQAECGGGGSQICDSGLSVGDEAGDTCLGNACCDEANACTSNAGDVQACIDCAQAGGGPLCDALLECFDSSGC